MRPFTPLKKRLLIIVCTAAIPFFVMSLMDHDVSAGTAFYTTGSAGAGGGAGFADGGVTGTGVNTRVAYWNSAHTITGSGNFTFDGGTVVIGPSNNIAFDAVDGVNAINPARVCSGPHCKGGGVDRVGLLFQTSPTHEGQVTVGDNRGANGGDLGLFVNGQATGTAGDHIRLYGRPSNVQTVWMDIYDGVVDVPGNGVLIGSATVNGNNDRLDVTKNAYNLVEFEAFGTEGAAAYPDLHLARSDGTRASPTPVQSGDTLGQLSYSGQPNTVLGSTNVGACIIGRAAETWTSTANGTNIEFGNVVSGTQTACIKHLTLNNNGNLIMAGDYNWIPATDNQGSIGVNANRFKLVRAVTITSGDIGFDDDVCAVCGKPFEVDDDIVMHVHKKVSPDDGKPYVLTVPIHADCRPSKLHAVPDTKSFWQKWFE